MSWIKYFEWYFCNFNFYLLNKVLHCITLHCIALHCIVLWCCKHHFVMLEHWAEKKVPVLQSESFILPPQRELPLGWGDNTSWERGYQHCWTKCNSMTIVRDLVFLRMDSPIYWRKHNKTNSFICMTITLYCSIAKAHKQENYIKMLITDVVGKD